MGEGTTTSDDFTDGSVVQTWQCGLTVHLPADIWTVIPPNNTDVKLEHGPM